MIHAHIYSQDCEYRLKVHKYTKFENAGEEAGYSGCIIKSFSEETGDFISLLEKVTEYAKQNSLIVVGLPELFNIPGRKLDDNLKIEMLAESVRKLSEILEKTISENRELEARIRHDDKLLRRTSEKISEFSMYAEEQHDAIVALEKTVMDLDFALEEFGVDDGDFPKVPELIAKNYPKRIIN